MLLASVIVSIIAGPDQLKAANDPSAYTPQTTPYSGTESWYCKRITGAVDGRCSVADLTASISTLALLASATALTSVGALAAGSATTGFTINASNVTWAGTVPTANLAFTLPLAIANGGTGSASPTPVAGAGILFTGSWPNQTIKVKTPGVYNAFPTNPAGTASTTGVMMGLKGGLSPLTTGTFLITIGGSLSNSNGTAGCSVTLRYGTGAQPNNGDALIGTTGGQSSDYFVSAGTSYGFAVTAAASGLSLGTAEWFDISLAAITAGTCTASGINISVIEP